jgi:hypothetical protein
MRCSASLVGTNVPEENITDSFHPENCGDVFLRNICSYKRDDVTFHRTVFFIVTAVKSSNLTIKEYLANSNLS